jgi:hypothetical protein
MIVVATANSLEESAEEVPFDVVKAPQAAATTATTKTAHVEDADDEVPVCFDPLQIHTRVEMAGARCFAEEAGFMGSETVAPNLFGCQTVGKFLGHGLDPLNQRILLILWHMGLFSCHQNQEMAILGPLKINNQTKKLAHKVGEAPVLC